MPVKARPIAERFWPKVDKRGPNDCWLWTGSFRYAYGRISVGAHGAISAHRASWEIHNGPIPPGMFVCHRCDVPACVNPSHLFVGTHIDNETDKDAKGRRSRGARHSASMAGLMPCGVDNHKSKLTPAKVQTIRLLARHTAMSRAEIASMFGVTKENVVFVVARTTWRDTVDLAIKVSP